MCSTYGEYLEKVESFEEFLCRRFSGEDWQESRRMDEYCLMWLMHSSCLISLDRVALVWWSWSVMVGILWKCARNVKSMTAGLVERNRPVHCLATVQPRHILLCVYAAWCTSSLLGRTAWLSVCVPRTYTHHQDTICRCPPSYQGTHLGLLRVSDRTLVWNSTPRYKKTRPIGHCESKWCLCTLPRNLANFVTFFKNFFTSSPLFAAVKF